MSDIIGQKLASILIRNVAKGIVVVASIHGMLAIGNPDKFSINSNAEVIQYTVVFLLSIGSVIYGSIISHKDFAYIEAPIWKGMFSPRKIVKVRQMIGAILTSIKKFPVIGIMFSFFSYIKNEIMRTFGRKKIWRTSHYSLVWLLLIGLFMVTNAVEHYVYYISDICQIDLKEYASENGMEKGLLNAIHTSGYIIYGIALYLAGTIQEIDYLKLMAIAFPFVGIMIEFIGSLDKDTTDLNLPFFLMNIALFLAIYRIIFREDPYKNSQK